MNIFFQKQCLLGEGPIWNPFTNKLNFVDILNRKLYLVEEGAHQEHEFESEKFLTSVTPIDPQNYLLTTKDSLKIFNSINGSLIEISENKNTSNNLRFNDAKCDVRGRFWVGTMDMNVNDEVGKLFCYKGEADLVAMREGNLISNGMGWSPDSKYMYFTDSPKRKIYRYNYNIENGEISDCIDLITVEEEMGVPDGLSVDSEGCIWSAHWDGWGVSKYSPAGKRLTFLELPVPRPTSCCFGGDDLKTLFITSASVELSDEELKKAPKSGSVFSLSVDVAGLPTNSFVQ